MPRSHNTLTLQPFLFLCANCQHTQQHLALKIHASQLKTSRHHPPSYALLNLDAAQTLLTITSMSSSKFAKMPNKDPSRATSLQQMMSALSSSGQTAIKLANQEAPQTTLYSAPTLRLWPGNLMWHDKATQKCWLCTKLHHGLCCLADSPPARQLMSYPALCPHPQLISVSQLSPRLPSQHLSPHPLLHLTASCRA